MVKRRRRAISGRWALPTWVILQLVSCSGGPTEPRVDPTPRVTVGQPLSGTLATGESRDFQLELGAGETYLLSFQTTSGSSADTLIATVRPAMGGAAIALARSPGTQADLHDGMVPIAPAGQTRELLVTVTGAGPTHDGPFILLVRPMSGAPERAAASLATSAIATEELDALGDIDEFTVTGSTGHVAWLQIGAEVSFADGLHASLLDGSTVLTTATATAPVALGTLESEPVYFPRSGSFTIRMRAGSGAPSANTGRYQLRLMAIPPSSPPTPRVLESQTLVLDTLAGPDSVAAFQLFWSSTQIPAGFALDLIDAAPSDTVIATIRRGYTGDSIGTIIAVPGGGQRVLALPLPPLSAVEPPIAIVRAARRNANVVYRVRLGSPQGDAPEHAVPTLVPGDTVAGETIADYFDWDEFVFDPAPPDSEWVVMLAPLDTITSSLRVHVSDRDRRLVQEWEVLTNVHEMERGAMYLKLGTQGPYVIRVSGGGFRGEYRLRVLRIDRGTESAPSQLAIDDSLSSAIEQPGDFDEYRVDATAGDELYFHHETASPTADQVFTLLDGGNPLTVLPLPERVLPIDEQLAHYRWVVPRSGTFTVRINRSLVRGRASEWPSTYSIGLRRAHPTPELIPATGWAYGDTISGESLSWRGDVDEFDFDVDSVRMTRFVLIAPVADSGAAVHAAVFGPTGEPVGRVSVGSSDSVNAIAHLEFTAAGRYRIQVQGTSRVPVAYRVFAVPSYLGPEVIGDTLPVGPWVSGEAIDSIGDADRFVYAVDSGRRYVVEIEREAGATGGFAFFSTVTFADTYGLHTFSTPTSAGWVRAHVLSQMGPDGPALGPYRLRISTIDFGPETAQPTVVIGDTITTEAIDLYGDEDHFTFDGTAGDSLRLTLRTANVGSEALVAASVVRADGELIAVKSFSGDSVDFGLPATGSYRIRVSAVSMDSTRDLGPYLLALVRR